MVEEGVNGHVVADRDPGALAAALRTLLEDPAATAAKGARGREILLRRFAEGTLPADVVARARETIGRVAAAAIAKKVLAQFAPIITFVLAGSILAMRIRFRAPRSGSCGPCRSRSVGTGLERIGRTDATMRAGDGTGHDLRACAPGHECRSPRRRIPENAG